MIDNMLGALLGRDGLDERFVVHRYRASRLSLVVGIILMGGWFLYDRYANGVTHVEIAVIILAMAVTKLAAMAYYRLTG